MQRRKSRRRRATEVSTGPNSGRRAGIRSQITAGESGTRSQATPVFFLPSFGLSSLFAAAADVPNRFVCCRPPGRKRGRRTRGSRSRKSDVQKVSRSRSLLCLPKFRSRFVGVTLSSPVVVRGDGAGRSACLGSRERSTGRLWHR